MSRRKFATVRRLVGLLDRERTACLSDPDSSIDPQWRAGFCAGLTAAQAVVRKGL
ncbi:hypothetical protein ACPZ19_43635 [Amycolatopsis lurida]